MIRLTIPSLDESEQDAVREVLASGYLVQGERVARFEQAVAEYVGRKHAVAVSNCTAALHLSLLALEIGAGDMVVTTAYSFVATANVVELCSAEPVFVDVQPDTFNLDPNRLEERIKKLRSSAASSHRLRAILPVHTFGQVADMTALQQISDAYGLPIVEDAACALGARWEGSPAGSWGVVACYSFHPRKAITTGEGGMIISDDADLVRTMRALRNHGQDPSAPYPDFVMPGFNYRMTELQAAIGLVQMEKLERVISARRRLAANYDRLLANTPLQPPFVPPNSHPVYQSYVIMLPEELALHRAAIIRWLKAEGIETTIGTWHMPMTTYFRSRYGYQPGDFAVTDRVFARSLTLPLYEDMKVSDQERVVSLVLAALRAARDGGL